MWNVEHLVSPDMCKVGQDVPKQPTVRWRDWPGGSEEVHRTSCYSNYAVPSADNYSSRTTFPPARTFHQRLCVCARGEDLVKQCFCEESQRKTDDKSVGTNWTWTEQTPGLITSFCFPPAPIFGQKITAVSIKCKVPANKTPQLFQY